MKLQPEYPSWSRKNNQILGRHLADINKCSSTSVSLIEVKDPQLGFYQEVPKLSSVPFLLQRQAVDALSKLERAREEAQAIELELKCMVDWLREEHTKMERAHSQLISPHTQGASSVVSEAIRCNEDLQAQYYLIYLQLFDASLPIDSAYISALTCPSPLKVTEFDAYSDQMNLYLEVSDDDLPTDEELWSRT